VWRALLAAGVTPPGAVRRGSHACCGNVGTATSKGQGLAAGKNLGPEGSALASAITLGDSAMALELMEHGAWPTDNDLSACLARGQQEMHSLLLCARGGH
jgi:hypothetical protein